MNRMTGFALSMIIGASMALQGGDELSNAVATSDGQEMRARIKKGEGVNDFDKSGWTALMWATFYYQDSAVRWLLSHGADPNLASTSKTRFFPKGTAALSVAAKFSNESIIKSLLDAGANPLAVDSTGVSPMDYAKASNSEACLALLREKPLPPPLLHSSTHPLITESLDDLCIAISSYKPDSQYFLSKLKSDLDTELEKRHIRHLVCIVDPLKRESIKEIEAFKPKYILQWTESEVKVHVTPKASLYLIEFHGVLKRNGGTDPLWVKDSLARGTWHGGRNYGKDAYKYLASALIEDLEKDLLLKP